MRNFHQDFAEIFKCGSIREETIKRHIDHYVQIERFIRDLAGFFYVFEYPSGPYHFLGSQQEHISGYTNDEVFERGLDLFFRGVHPSEIDILLKKLFPDMAAFVAAQEDECIKKSLIIQYNYRFRRKGGSYVNLLDNMHILELDDEGRPSLTLGNVIMLQNGYNPPVCLKIRQFQSTDLPQTVFTRVYTSLPDQWRLTPREAEILRHLARGDTSREIGQKLCISQNTVDTHRRRLLRKLQCNNVVEMTRIAFQYGLL